MGWDILAQKKREEKSARLKKVENLPKNTDENFLKLRRNATFLVLKKRNESFLKATPIKHQYIV